MKKVKVENYKRPSYSTLKMVTGKMLPAGLAIATMINIMPNTNAQGNKSANFNTNINELKNIEVIMGDVPNTEYNETEENRITVLINQALIDFDVEPILENGIVLVPMRKIFETLGAYVNWDDQTKTAFATKGGDIIAIAVNDTKMIKNGREIMFDVATKIIDGRLLVPFTAVSEGLDCNITWNEINHQVIINSNEEEMNVTGGALPVVD